MSSTLVPPHGGFDWQRGMLPNRLRKLSPTVSFDPDDYSDRDGLGGARGLISALIISAAFWAIIVPAIWHFI